MSQHKEAMFYKSRRDGGVQCFLCPHHCVIYDDKVGLCGVRKNLKGKLYSLIYGKVSSMALDPIEKKPLRNFHSGSNIFSIGSLGCNLSCPFCQNHCIAKVDVFNSEPEVISISSEEMVEKAWSLKPRGNVGIAYTYNEPSVWYEFVLDTAKLAKEKGLLNIMVTNGYLNSDPLKELLPYIDAMNIDLKAFNQEFYKNIGNGNLEIVKKSIEQAASTCHVEVTTLVIPDLNDSPNEMDKMCEWLASINPLIPLHLSRYFPRYQMRDKEPTSYESLSQLADIARKHLKYVYLGNV
ncbi:MAG: AmmeMemoRadiSam system radical SAM enzyme [Anaerovoracaceae bacterium]|jgi:pyruvate formate lyase activating enzyme